MTMSTPSLRSSYPEPLRVRSAPVVPVDASELSEVAAMQRQLLPAAMPALPGFEFAVAYRPCVAAGGDYYDFQQFADGRVGIVVADVSGHGAGAAVMMAVMRGAFAAFRVFGRLRDTAAQDVNAIVNDVSVPGVFVTAFLVSLDPETGRIYCGNCGHPSPMIRRSDASVAELSGPGDLPFGISEQINPPMLEDQLGPGDALVLYTDGVTESRDTRAEFFGETRLREVISAASGTDAASLVAAVIAAVDEHQGAATQSDDQCVLVCRRKLS
jgi:sigma-B regulation protein RsbU (phosphoserine phosphatase)